MLRVLEETLSDSGHGSDYEANPEGTFSEAHRQPHAWWKVGAKKAQGRQSLGEENCGMVSY